MSKNSLSTKQIKWLLILLSILFYIASLATPALYVNPNPPYDNGATYGLTLLIMGFLGILAGCFAWCSNILYFIALGFMIKCKNPAATILSMIAFILAFAFLFFHNVPFDEGGGIAEIHFGIGYFLWLSAMLIIFISNLIFFKSKQDEPGITQITK